MYRFSMAEINLENVRVFAPQNPNATRIYNFLKAMSEKSPGMFIKRPDLLVIASKGMTRDEAWAALQHLKRVVDCVFVWDSVDRVELICVAPMTTEEKLKAIEDDIWFESLPDIRPQKIEVVKTPATSKQRRKKLA